MLFLLSVQDQPANKNANILPKISHFHNNLEARKVTHILINALPNPRFVSFKKKKKSLLSPSFHSLLSNEDSNVF